MFTCQCGQKLTSLVEITDHSKYKLIFITKIEGSKAYSVYGESEFAIDIKKAHEVKILVLI